MVLARLQKIVAISLLPILIECSIPVSAQVAEGAGISDTQLSSPLSSTNKEVELAVRKLDRQILLELIKLAEFNLRYQQALEHYPRWRKLFYPAAQEAAYAGLLGFSVTDLNQRGNGLNNTKLISEGALKRGLSAATVGSLVGASSSIIEIAANGYETSKLNKKGYSVRSSVSFVKSAVERVNNILDARRRMMEGHQFTETQKELLNLKEQLLIYERDRLVFEFTRWSAHSRGYAWYRNTFLAVNSTVNFGRFTATLLGFKAFSADRYSGGLGPILISSSFLAGMGPAASSAVGKRMERHHQRTLSRDLPVGPLMSDEEAKAKFERLAQILSNGELQQTNPHLAEVIRLREEKIGLDTLIYHEDRHIQRLRRVAGQLAIGAPAISALGLASGILNTVGYHGYRLRPLVRNRLSFAGGCNAIPAEGVALIATPGVAAIGYMYERRLKKKGEHPEQLRTKRLQDLDRLKTILAEDVW